MSTSTLDAPPREPVTSFGRALLALALRTLPKRRLSRVIGWLSSRRLSDFAMRQAIAAYVRAYRVDLSDAAVPPGGFRSFDAFFTRALRPSARPVSTEPNCLVVPADGVVLDAGVLQAGASLRIKRRRYSLREILSDEDAGKYAGGRFAVIYLAPGDYHRVHAPVSGRVRAVRHVGGTLFPVNAIGLALAPRLFASNERVAVFQETEALGPLVTVLVGALGVGRIGLSFDDSVMTGVGPPATKHYLGATAPDMRRGDELGVFHLGSTVIVITGPDEDWDLAVSPGDRVRVGQVLARAARAR
jgi:phosphatidylserine decarboxylase